MYNLVKSSFIRRCIFYALLFFAIAPAIYLSLSSIDLTTLSGVAILLWVITNLVAWILIAAGIQQYEALSSALISLFGVNQAWKGIGELPQLVEQLRRKESAFGISFTNTERSLFENINNILNTAKMVLPIRSAELTVYDRESGLYHGSFLAGEPFRVDISMALVGSRVCDVPLPFSGVTTLQDGDSTVYILPLVIAKVPVGLLRILLRSPETFSVGDWGVLEIVCRQCTRAFLEADFTGQIVRMRAESEASVKLKAGFLAHLSHEIRGPLGIMLNGVELVLEGLCGEVTPDQEETLAMVKQNGSHLLELVNDVLDFAKVESGRMTTEPEVISVAEFLSDIANVTMRLADSKGHQYIYTPPKAPLFLSCDRRHLRQILINLLTNAIKYTQEKGVIKLYVVESLLGVVRIVVEDSGIGIAEEDRDRVFAPFERIERGYARGQKGTGIGMSLTKELVELNGGEIDFSSVEGKGSVFWVDFSEVKEGTSVAAPSATETTEIVRGDGLAVVTWIQEDGERELVSRYFAHIGFTVTVCSGFEEVRRVVTGGTCDLLILDLKSSEIETLARDVEHLRQAASPAWFPILVITGEAFHCDMETILRSGADRCLVKPLTLKNLAIASVSIIKEAKKR